MLKVFSNVAIFGTFAVVAAFLAFVLWGALFGPKKISNAPNNADATQTQNQGDNKKLARSGTLPSLSQRTDEAIADYTKWLAVFTAFLVLATIALFVSGERNVEVSRQAADAANRSAQIAEDGLVKLQRAFVSLQQIRHISHEGPHHKVWWSIYVVWENFGTSRATNVKFFVSKYFEDKDLDDSFQFTVPEQKTGTFIAPKAVVGSGELSITGDELVEVRDGKKFLYFWGRVDYRDIFDGTPDHVTKFLTKVSAIRGDPTKVWNATTNVVELVLVGDNQHTCADEGCGDN